MLVDVRTFSLPKNGNTDDEYEDAFWPDTHQTDQSLNGFRSAVADGATETSFSGAWANLLVRRWCEEAGYPKLLDALPQLKQEWEQQIGVEPLPWYAEEKARAGAFSSLLGIEFTDDALERGESGEWKAVAVGDSCLFHIRNNELIERFPLKTAEEFNNSPYLISSTMQTPQEILENTHYISGAYENGDRFYLMTDALACWFLKGYSDNTSIVAISDIEKQSTFMEFVAHSRNERDNEGLPLLRNDDVTLMRLDIHI